eukprot:245476_1
MSLLTATSICVFILHAEQTSIMMTDSAEKLTIDFSFQFLHDEQTTKHQHYFPIWSIYKDEYHLLNTSYKNNQFYVSFGLDSTYYLIGDENLFKEDTHAIHMEYNKFNHSSSMMSNLFCRINDTIKRLVVPNIDMHNFTHIKTDGFYEVHFATNNEWNLFNFSLTKTQINHEYNYVEFTNEYSNINYVSSNAMTEDIINDNFNNISFQFTNLVDTDIDNLSLLFEFNRSSNMIIKGAIDTFNFDMIYKEVISDKREIKNENHIVNATTHWGHNIFNYCNYPVPSDYNYIYTTQWIDLYLDAIGTGENQYGIKQQLPECRDSYHPFWTDPYMNICQDPTDFLRTISNKQDVFTKVFECTSLNQRMTEYNWYYSIEQLQILAGNSYADKIKIVVHDHENNTMYSAVSMTDSYPIINLRNNRSLSNPLFYNISQPNTYYFDINAWNNYTSDTILLEYMNNNINNKCSEFHPFNYSYLN